MRVYFRALSILIVLGSMLAACGAATPAAETKAATPLIISAIPDQDPEKLNRLYPQVAAYLSAELGIPVEYKPVTDYTAAVTAFKVGDLDLVWYGGLTGVQARLQVPGAQAIVQRDIDATFHSIFITNSASGIASIADLKGKTFTFGSETSTSGRLMPQYFLGQEGIQLSDFKGEAGFSGSHDKTIGLVESGTYDAGAVNEQVWKKTLADGKVDQSKVVAFYTTPAYYDYHWVLNPGAVDRYGADFTQKVQQAFFKLDPAKSADKEILDLFGATKFIATTNENYTQIETIGRAIGKITP
ncbi:MAG: putative selenate ABC transporter substrate-binding protein [Herpetosiphonaceae bacterium]|nr:putative selenate ABC transporter substrate-binding protein [Herpetosiphonaceae bacterium]